MNSKFKLVALATLVAVVTSGCSSYRGATQRGNGYEDESSVNNGGSRGGLFGQSQRSNHATVSDSCAVCAASKAQNTYTYKPTTPAPATASVSKPAPKPAGQHNQQYYIERWNRQQAQQSNQNQQPQNYAGYGQNGQNNTTYYDYSSAAGKPANTAVASNTTSNKSIYTGSYQQKTYTPTTYAGGSAAPTKTTTVASSGGGSTYTVKKGDTVFEIMRQTGVYWKDIININNLQPPYNINPGQTLRLK